MAIIKGTIVATRDIFNTAKRNVCKKFEYFSEEVSKCLLHQHHLILNNNLNVRWEESLL